MTVLLADPCISDIPVRDNGEPSVDLVSLGICCLGPSAVGHRARAGVAMRLRAARAALPFGIGLLVYEGQRSPEAQRAIHSSYSLELRETWPTLADDEISRLASRYVAPLAVAPHVAGAAVDLTLMDADGRELWMGTPIDATPEESDNAIAFAAENIDEEARWNRELLARVLTDAGLVNYPTEWWHWSYGDRYWAHATGAREACYGPIGAVA